jgi:hypothetical protein
MWGPPDPVSCSSTPVEARSRALADALVEAADLADDYDADPDAFNERDLDG